jgi:hypothetical protein
MLKAVFFQLHAWALPLFVGVIGWRTYDLCNGVILGLAHPDKFDYYFGFVRNREKGRMSQLPRLTGQGESLAQRYNRKFDKKRK